jgi:hypothetical protein
VKFPLKLATSIEDSTMATACVAYLAATLAMDASVNHLAITQP